MMHFRTFEDLNSAIIKNLYKVPQKIDLIAGVPRSGLLAANLLALHLQLPLTDIDGLKNGRILSAGERLKPLNLPVNKPSNILVVDDSLHTGKSMMEIRDSLAGINPDRNIIYAAVFIKPGRENLVDFYFEPCPVPRLFEWNIMNHRYIRTACVDIDGVLCLDPTPEENDDGINYLRFLKKAKPYLRSRNKIGTLVTNRLEKYRDETESWLEKNNIHYGELVMRNLPDQKARREANNYGEFKASEFTKRPDAKLFIESSYHQSKVISRISGRPVYCVDKREMILPDTLKTKRKKSETFIKRAFRKVRNQILF